MSARQRQRLQKQLKQLDDEPQDDPHSESSEEEEGSLQVKSGFSGLSAFSDSSSSDDDEEDATSDQNEDHFSTSEEEMSDGKGRLDEGRDDDEELLLEKAIEEVAATRAKDGTDWTDASIIDYSLLFGVDKNSLLDVDVFVSRRFGKYQSVMAESAGMPGGKKKVGRTTSARKSIFGCKEEWPKPLSFVAGGLGQKQVDGRYLFEESKEWKRSESLFRIVREFGDINRAILFLLYCNEVHPESLLMLSKVFAVYGRMDKALDSVRRVLYTYECASLTNFFSAENIGRHSPASVLDWRLVQNAPLFTALSRYMFLVGMQGYHSLARDAARVLLSLSRDDPTMVLLALDHYLVVCNDQESRAIFLAFMGISRLMPTSTAASFDIEWVGNVEGKAAFPLLELDDEKTSSVHSVLHLGSWWLSLALLEEQKAQEIATNDTTPDLHMATALVAEAFCRFPYMLEPLLDCLEDVATSTRARFEEAKLRPPFTSVCQSPEVGADSTATATATATPLTKQEEDLFTKLGSVYSIRNKSLWQPRVALLLAGVECAVTKCEDKETFLRYSQLQREGMTTSPALLKYAQANPEHFAEEIAQFPADVDPIAPQLADIDRLLEPLQLRQQRGILRRTAAEHFAYAGGYEELVQTTLIQGLQNGDPFRDDMAAMGENVWEQEGQLAMQMDAGLRIGHVVAAIEEERMQAEQKEGSVDGSASDQGQEPNPNPGRVIRREELIDGNFLRSESSSITRSAREAPRLDYNAPLMQLLLQSFFCPWFRL